MKSLGRFLLTRFLLIYVLLVVLGLIALTWSHLAAAQTPCPTGAVPSDAARVCWVNASLNVDGSTIPATGAGALRDTRIRRSLCNADGSFGAVVETLTLPMTIGVVLFTGLPPGQHCFQARHSNNANEFSDWSGTVRKTTTAPAPPKPRQPNVTIA